MNEALSTLIAFVGVLIVLSMVVQSLQEALKNFLKLRAKTWERFFYELYKQEFSVGSLREGSQPPPGMFSVGKYAVGNFEDRMKRLTEIVVKTDNGIKSLKDSLFKIVNINQADPDAQKQLLPLLKKASDAITGIMGLQIDSALKIYDRFDKEEDTAKTFLSALAVHDNTIKQLIMSQMGDPFTIKNVQTVCKELYNFLVANERKISDYRQQIESKVDSWISQVEEEYKKNMLCWTLMIGLALVMVFNADTFNIYKYLSVDTQIKDTVIKKASETTPKTQKADPAMLNQVDALIRAGKVDDSRALLTAFAGKLQEDYRAYDDKEKDKEIDSIVAELKAASAKSGEDQKKPADGLASNAGKLTKLYVGLQKKAVEFQIDKLGSLDLPLGWTTDLPQLKSVYSYAIQQPSTATGHSSLRFVFAKLGGLLLTWILITFGAPFWNDVLGLLTGLKTAAFKKG